MTRGFAWCAGSRITTGAVSSHDHLRHLELLGRSPITVDHRKRAVVHARPRPRASAPGTAPVRDASRTDHHVAPRPVCVTEATAGELYAWRDSLRVADATAANYMSQIKEFYRFLVATGYRPDDPSAGIPVPVTPRRLPRPIPEADLMRALECAPERIRLMIVLAAWCGLRCKELANLRREHIRDTAENRVRWSS